MIYTSSCCNDDDLGDPFLRTDKLDGLAGGGKRKRDVSAMEDFLQLPDDYASRMSQPGKKRVNIMQNVWPNFYFTPSHSFFLFWTCNDHH